MNGLLLVNKPPGITSHDVVAFVRRKLRIRRVGHTGTLDPMAQGLLIILVGTATKHQQTSQTHEKLYEAALQLGQKTDTADATGQVIENAAVPSFLDPAHVAQVLASFEGLRSQIPPRYSAVKVHGRPAYFWARRNRDVLLRPKNVCLFEMCLMRCESPLITFRVRCSAGTYVRVIAEDIAEQLGTVGHLSHLIRLGVGPWDLNDAHSWAWMVEATSEQLASQLRPISLWGSSSSPPHKADPRSSAGSDHTASPLFSEARREPLPHGTVSGS